MKRSRLWSGLVVLPVAFGFVAQGCATVFHGTRQDVHIASDDPNATVQVDGAIMHPGNVELARGEDHRIAAEEPGKLPVTTKIRSRLSWGYAIVDTLLGVVFFPLGLVFPIVDLLDGAMFNLEPESVYLPRPAEPVNPPASPPSPVRRAGAELH